MINANTDLRKEYELYLLSCLGMDIDELIDTRCMPFEDFVKEQRQMKIQGYFLNERLTKTEKDNLYDECIGCLNRICVTEDKAEVLTMLASLQTKAMLLGKNTFLRIDEEMERNSGMYCEDVLDDIVNWCNDFLS